MDLTINCQNQAGWGLNDIIACTSGGDAIVVDLYGPFKGKGLELTHIVEDDPHPNNAGYKVLTAAVQNAYRAR
jgi:hypothetical protein